VSTPGSRRGDASTGGAGRVPEESHPRIAQAGVVLKAASDVPLARALAGFLVGPGRATLERRGYTMPN
jgi:hypothetical protein